jgi:hypothetical protein
MSNKSSRKNSAKTPIKKKSSNSKQQQPQQQSNNTKENVDETKNSKKNPNSNKNASKNTPKKKEIAVEQAPKREVVAVVPKKNQEEPKKLERSNSFIGTLSKLYNKLSESVENLTKIAKEPEKISTSSSSSLSSLPLGFKFQRSLTLNSFQLKKTYRKSILENSRLEKLSEEKISEGKTTTTPPKSPSLPPVTLRSHSPTTYRQSMPVGSFDRVDFTREPPPTLKRSDSFISLIKRKISFNDIKPSPPSPPSNNSTNLRKSWAMSLQNLQQIDNMVSYEGKFNLKFINIC